MAKNLSNVVVSGLSGSLGRQVVLKRDKAGRTIVSAHPTYKPDRVFTALQLNHQNAFREAVAYALSAQSNKIYAKKAAGTPLSPYNLAVADWFNSPQILDIDLAGWTGQPGRRIRVKALDDVLVKQVSVIVTDQAGALLEQGPATQVDNLWWEYTTTATGTGVLKVTASAQDLPGHTAQLTKSSA